VSLAMLGPLDRKIAHLSLDHAWIASVPALRIDLLEHLGKQYPVVIIIVCEGGKIPVSTRGTG
jgi:hypothetical protein